MVKVVPANGNASGSQVMGKGLKVVCGNHRSHVPGGAWVKDKTPLSFCQVRVSPSYAVTPNIGASELADALSRVLPFASDDDARPMLRHVKATQKDGRLTLVATDGFSLAEIGLDFEAGEAEALIDATDIKALVPALRKAKRARLAIANGEGVNVDTEAISYKWPGASGNYPDYAELFPPEFKATASFDTNEAIRACRSLLAIWFDDGTKGLQRPLTLTIADNKVMVDTKEDRGTMAISAETEGEAKVSVVGTMLLKVLKACSGIAEMKLTGEPTAPIVFATDGYRALVMPWYKDEGKAEAEGELVAKPKRKGKGKAKPEAEQTEAEQTEAEQAEPAAVA